MKSKFFIATLTVLVVFFSCTDDFIDDNENPIAFTSDQVSAKFFVTNVQTNLYAPNRFPYWRGPLIHADRFAGQHAFGYSANWWNDGLAYNYHSGYTDAVYGWLSGYNSTLTAYLNFVNEGGDLENSNYYAIGLIMKGLYYQFYTDTFGMVPYSEASNPDIVTPKYDSLQDIYTGIISDLDTAISLIGTNTVTGTGVDLLGDNDLFFGGDLQTWKQLANSLKLRLGLRAHGAAGADFASTAVSSAISDGVLTEESAIINRDININQWVSATYGDIWHNFFGGGHWNLGVTMVDALRDNHDPRLFKYAKPSDGGTIEMTKPTEGDNKALFDKHINFITDLLDSSEATYTTTTDADGNVTLSMDEGTFYVGFPTRANGKIKPYLHTNLFSKPADIVTNKKNTGSPIFPYLVLTSAECHLMVAEAIVKGLSEGDAQSQYEMGIRKAMKLWDVTDADIDQFISSEDMAQLNGTPDENLEKIAIQRWLANYTNGFESWAIVRDTGYPSSLAAGVLDSDIYELGDLNGAYPQRMRYGSSAYSTNGDNTTQANSIQGDDKQATKLWWAK